MKTKRIPDNRYSVNLKAIGLNRPVYVAYFCNDPISVNPLSYSFTKAGAVSIARKHRADFLRIITGRKPAASISR